MKRTALALTLIWALLFSTLVTVQCAGFASAQVNGPIIITADGDVEPSTAPIQRVGDVYTLTNDIGVVKYDAWSSVGIQVLKDDIVIDGANFSIYAKYTNGSDGNHYAGLDLGLRDNVEVRNLEIRGFERGISVHGLLYTNEEGRHTYCDNITIAKNNITNCKYGIITRTCCRNVMIYENYLSKNDYGLELALTWESLISGNYFAKNRFGANVVASSQNKIIENNFVENTEGAVRLSQATNNTFCHNNFINNSLFGSCQISNPWIAEHSIGENNIWDNGSIGNYWNDFKQRFPNASEVFGKGVWNTPYFINEENIDQYPLVAPYGTVNDSLPILPCLLLVIATVAIVGLAIFRKKSKKRKSEAKTP